MSKKQIRIQERDKVQNRLPEFLNKKINIVLTDNTVVFGELTKIDATSIGITNMRLKLMTIPIKNISELYYDIDA